MTKPTCDPLYTRLPDSVFRGRGSKPISTDRPILNPVEREPHPVRHKTRTD